MPAQVSEFVKSYSSFSGVDIKVAFASKTIGELQAISVSITREKAPIYTMGSADARGFARGKRGIAGTLVFIMFDRHAMLEELRELMFQSDKDDIQPAFKDEQGASLEFELRSSSARTASTPLGGGIFAQPSAVQQESQLNGFVNEDQEHAHPWYVDQIPGFDITLAAANEYGDLAKMGIFGAEILNEGMGMSIDDLVIEQQMTYIARTVIPWQWVKNPDTYFGSRSSYSGTS